MCVLYARPPSPPRPCACSQLLRDNKVRFAGYQHPHPLENDILVKIQASTKETDNATPLSVLRSAVVALTEEVDHVQDSFRVRCHACFPTPHP